MLCVVAAAHFWRPGLCILARIIRLITTCIWGDESIVRGWVDREISSLAAYIDIDEPATLYAQGGICYVDNPWKLPMYNKVFEFIHIYRSIIGVKMTFVQEAYAKVCSDLSRDGFMYALL
jgi:hypothetical protein